jgi:hypothetical protein
MEEYIISARQRHRFEYPNAVMNNDRNRFQKPPFNAKFQENSCPPITIVKPVI